MNMKEKKEIKPIIKNVFRKTLKPVKNALILVGIATLSFSGYNIGREVYESTQYDNTVVDVDFGPFGSYVLFNTDTRTAIQVYDDVINTALNVEGLEDVYSNSENMTIEQRKDFLSKFTKEISEAAGIRIDNVIYENPETYGAHDGHYVGRNSEFLAFSKNNIHINENILNYPTLIRGLEISFHEVIHAVENINVQTNKNVDNLDISLHNSGFFYGNKVYYSNFHEITAYLLMGKFRMGLEQKFSPNELNYEYYVTVPKLSDWLNEVVENDMKYHNREKEYYDTLTIKQLIDLGIQNNYDYKKVEFSQEILENSYTYDVINYAVPSYFFNVTYKDFELGYAQFKDWNLQEETEVLQEYIENYNLGKYSSIGQEYMFDDYGLTSEDYKNNAEQTIARQMAKLMAIVRYDANSYDEENVKMAFYLIQNNLELIKESTVEFYRLDQTQDIKIQTAQDPKNNSTETVQIEEEADLEY